ncbi:MAG: hypothetical protein WD607_01035, partial [Candidatus Paceibacterota bacterium]
MTSVFLLIAFVLLSSFPDSLTVQEKVKQQVNFYVSQLEKANNPELTIWALNQLSMLNCEAVNMVKLRIRGLQDEYSDFYQNLDCENINDTSLENFELSKWLHSQKILYDYIKEEKGNLTPEILAPKELPLIHLKILMSDNYNMYYSKEYLEKALQAWKTQIDNHSGSETLQYSIILSNLIWAAYRLENYSIIQEYYQLFLDSKYLPLSAHKLRIMNGIDYVFYKMGHYDKSLHIQRNYSQPYTEFIQDKQENNQILLRQGVYLYSLGKYEESKNIYENLYRDAEEDDFYIFTNLGINYYMLGHLNKYLTFQLRALEHDAQNYKNLLTVYRNLFIYYTHAKDINSALQYIERAKIIALENSDNLELALIDFYIGSFYWSTYKNHEKALHHLNQAQLILTPEKDYFRYINLLIEKSIILLKTGSLEQAQVILNEVKELSLTKSDTPKYIEALV